MEVTPELQKLRDKLVSNYNKHTAFIEKHQKLCKKAIELIKAEPDKVKREKIIDFVFADKVEEVIEYHLRKDLKNNTDSFM